jgi:hypothetical protein
MTVRTVEIRPARHDCERPVIGECGACFFAIGLAGLEEQLGGRVVGWSDGPMPE